MKKDGLQIHFDVNDCVTMGKAVNLSDLFPNLENRNMAI